MWFGPITPRLATKLPLLFILIPEQENGDLQLVVLSLYWVEDVRRLLWPGANLGRSYSRGVSSGNPPRFCVVLSLYSLRSGCQSCPSQTRSCMAAKRFLGLLMWSLKLCVSCQAKSRTDGTCPLASGANVFWTKVSTGLQKNCLAHNSPAPYCFRCMRCF